MYCLEVLSADWFSKHVFYRVTDAVGFNSRTPENSAEKFDKMTGGQENGYELHIYLYILRL